MHNYFKIPLPINKTSSPQNYVETNMLNFNKQCNILKTHIGYLIPHVCKIHNCVNDI